MGVRRVAVVVLLLSAATTAPLGAQADADRILFVSTRAGAFDIFAVDPDGSDLENLTNTGGSWESDPDLAPDGTRMAFSRRAEGRNSWDIWLKSVVGRGQLRLTSEFGGAIDREPAWSPNGQRIVWTRSEGGPQTSRIWMMRADGSGRQPLTEAVPGVYDYSPAWSTDGSRIAFASTRGRAFPDIWVVGTDGSGLRRLTHTYGIEGHPAWSPDGTAIAFERRTAKGTTDVWRMRADGSGGSRRLTQTPTLNEMQPAWSADGEHLVYTGYPKLGGRRHLFTVPATGGPATQVLPGAMADFDADWGTMASVVSAPTGAARSASSADTDEVSTTVTDGGFSVAAKRVAPGVKLRRFRFQRSDIYAMVVNPATQARMDFTLGGRRLGERRPISKVAARHDAIAAINGDFPMPPGRPSQPFAADGDLKTTSFANSHNIAIRANETEAYLDHPVETLTVREASNGDAWPVDRWNLGGPTPNEVGVYSPSGAAQDRPPPYACSARLRPDGPRRWTGGREAITKPYKVEAVRCSPKRMKLLGGLVISAVPASNVGLMVSSLRKGERVSLSWSFAGWSGIADSMGGWPVLVDEGRNMVGDCSSAFCNRHPRTGIGITPSGRVLLVVADGRRPSSVGLRLESFAVLFKKLGASDAVNLDGGNSSEMWMKGKVVNRPSGGIERTSCCVALVLMGRDPGEHIASPMGSAAPAGSFPGTPRGPHLGSIHDPASTGGMLDAMARGDLGPPVELSPRLQAALKTFRSGR
jgi:Tol biopolymer transport system component